VHDDYIPQPRPRLSDEAAAQVLDFLYDFIADFESAYYVQLQRNCRDRDAARNLDHAPTPAPRAHRDDTPL
jgi:hypothetical protein